MKQQKSKGISAENFFRDIEIEFLIHELKDPISIIETGIRALLEKREKYGQLSVRQEKTLKRSLRNSRKVRTMLNGLLEIGRSEAGRIVCRRFQPIEAVYAVILDTLEGTESSLPEIEEAHLCFLQQFFSEQGIFLDIAPSVSDRDILQDETKFRHIVGNLLKNALHHRKNRTDISITRNGELLAISIRDDGPGIATEHHEAIFQRYTQLKDHPDISRKGHGLGLAGALLLARCLGGNIELESTQGQGATFRLIMPIELKTDTEDMED
ncbi:hypothetical protein CSA56_03185 [candidate division KSB3 bacterium]|uniref:histidine kinase n=1 Tax=candidate division KSB3 bacterium TaxID=2044937 RepID=A0A2G6KLH4_9BACT|nr:MAG: hypothetical protein CSA56_03185 [candidate division KSB3 bacterium]